MWIPTKTKCSFIGSARMRNDDCSVDRRLPETNGERGSSNWAGVRVENDQFPGRTLSFIERRTIFVRLRGSGNYRSAVEPLPAGRLAIDPSSEPASISPRTGKEGIRVDEKREDERIIPRTVGRLKDGNLSRNNDLCTIDFSIQRGNAVVLSAFISLCRCVSHRWFLNKSERKQRWEIFRWN